MSDGGLLPHAEHAFIDMRKLLAYSLNAEHPTGGHKARVFASVLGFGPDNASLLVIQIRLGLRRFAPGPARRDHFGDTYVVDMSVTGPKGEAILRTAWMVDSGTEIPRLVTAYVK